MLETQLIEASPTTDWWRCWFEGADEAQIICDAHGLALELNHRAVRLLSQPSTWRDAGLCLFDAIAEPVCGRLREVFRRRSERPETVLAAPVLVGGRMAIYADLRVAALNGSLYVVALRDCSQRVRLESHVHRLVTAIDATPDVYFLTDANFRITFVNPAFQTLTGFTIENILGLTAETFRAPGQEERIQEYLDSVQAGKDWTGEIVNRRADGSQFTVEATISPIYDRQGQLLGYASCERDITQRKQLQSELVRERNFVRGILHSMDAAVYVLDASYHLLDFNGVWQRFPAAHGCLKFEGAPEKGRWFIEYVSDLERRVELLQMFNAVRETGRPAEFECHGEDDSHWLVKVCALTNPEGAGGLVYQVLDQTNAQRLKSQLFQAQKMELVGALSAGIAHDFNNLLQAIRGNVMLLMMDGTLPQECSDRLQRVDQAACRAADITRQLLTFSRASQPKVEVLDLNSILDEVCQLARRTRGARVKMKVVPSEIPARVKMDATRASQLLLNLCVNAHDAMSDGGTLTLSNELVRLSPAQAMKHSAVEGATYVRCSVADNGKGIPPEVLPRIFEPFFTTKAKGAGTGLGLAIVQQVSSEAGGFIEIESEVGKGTTFHIFLPAVAEAISEPGHANDSQIRRGQGRILVVEDADLVREFTQTFLKVAGYTVETVPTGQEALARLETESYDLLLTDYDMPGMNGLELLRRATPRWPRMKVILASGYLELGARQEISVGLGCHVLNKPYNVREATTMVADILGCPA